MIELVSEAVPRPPIDRQGIVGIPASTVFPVLASCSRMRVCPHVLSPRSYPVMLKLMIWAETMVGSLRPRTADGWFDETESET